MISAPMNGLSSPTTIAWLISGCARSWSSRTAGATFLPPGGDDDFLLAAGDRQEAVVVDRAEVAGLEPAVGERLVGGLLVVPVAAEHHAAAHQQLAVVGDRACCCRAPAFRRSRSSRRRSWLTVIAALVSVRP